MEGLTPPLKFLLEIRAGLENGDGLRSILLKYFESNHDPFTEQAKKWFLAKEQKRPDLFPLDTIKMPYRKALLMCLEAGLAGQSILSRLRDLEEELKLACRLQIEEHTALLPLKLFLVVALFMFPALLLLILGPLVLHLLQELNR